MQSGTGTASVASAGARGVVVPGIRKDFIADYDGLADQWWGPARGALAPAGLDARARAQFVPPARDGSARLLDIACGGGLFGPTRPPRDTTRSASTSPNCHYAKRCATASPRPSAPT
ncbi:hypothetical protein CFP65_0002 [Kitasatospora sp. MMS16-BH015]|nr:hypothetical protein CFP65_0002 [Kitasatospora sp. MMS16-BH015]